MPLEKFRFLLCFYRLLHTLTSLSSSAFPYLCFPFLERKNGRRYPRSSFLGQWHWGNDESRGPWPFCSWCLAAVSLGNDWLLLHSCCPLSAVLMPGRHCHPLFGPKCLFLTNVFICRSCPPPDYVLLDSKGRATSLLGGNPKSQLGRLCALSPLNHDSITVPLKPKPICQTVEKLIISFFGLVSWLVAQPFCWHSPFYFIWSGGQELMDALSVRKRWRAQSWIWACKQTSLCLPVFCPFAEMPSEKKKDIWSIY